MNNIKVISTLGKQSVINLVACTTNQVILLKDQVFSQAAATKKAV